MSAVVCTHNGERFVADQLASILDQTRPPDELVVSDDASTDGTAEVVREATRRAGPTEVRVINRERRLGVVGNFSEAIAAATGDLVVLADQDDVWLGHKLEVIVDSFRAAPAALAVFSDAEIADRGLRRTGERLWARLQFSPQEQAAVAGGGGLPVLLRHNVVTGATLAFRAELRPVILPIPPWGLHDAWIGLVVAAMGGLRPIPEPLILYRQHGGNQVGVRERSPRQRLARRRTLGDVASAELRQHEALLGRLSEGGGAEPGAVDLIGEKIEHLRARAGLPPSPWSRILPVVREVRAGRYHRYSRGRDSWLYDLLFGPARDRTGHAQAPDP